MSNELIIIIILGIIIFGLLCLLGYCWYFFYKKHHYSEFKKVTNSKQKITQDQHAVELLKTNYTQKLESLSQRLEQLPSLSPQAAKQEFMNQLEIQSQSLIKEKLEEVRATVQEQAAQLIVETMEGLTETLVNDNCLTLVNVTEDSAKGRVIGKNGRNKKVFEALTKTDLIIDREDDGIVISSHNPVRREIATILLNRLLKSKVIEPARIEVLYEEIVNEFNEGLFSIGKEAVESELKIFDLPQALYPYIGRLKYRSSYGQNTLNHVIECARIANHMAVALGLDPDLASKCALLHDIGKANDYEVNQSHVDAGLAIISNLNLPFPIVNSIESHHGQVATSSIYAQLAILADTISAGRPGARINSTNELFERVQMLENLVKSFPEVTNAYALKSGRQLRVFVNPNRLEDGEFEWFAEKIKQKLKGETSVAGFNVKVIIIKEKRFEFNTGEDI